MEMFARQFCHLYLSVICIQHISLVYIHHYGKNFDPYEIFFKENVGETVLHGFDWRNQLLLQRWRPVIFCMSSFVLYTPVVSP